MARQNSTLSLVEAINYQTDVLKELPALIGRETAKHLLLADLPNVRLELQEEVLSELGFSPVEIVDRLYPNLGKRERRAKAQAVSKRLGSGGL